MLVKRNSISGRGRLILLSFLMFFVELALIRWLGSNVIYLSYFSNFVLLGSFLGIGIYYSTFSKAMTTPGSPPFTTIYFGTALEWS